MKYKISGNIVYSCRYHVVWCPKYKRNVLTDSIAQRLDELIRTQASENGIEILDIEIRSRYVRLDMNVSPQCGINQAVRNIKGFTSYYLRQEFPELRSRLPTLWTNSYFVSTSDVIPINAIEKYIENQNHDARRRESQSEIIATNYNILGCKTCNFITTRFASKV